MALIQMNYFSPALMRTIQVQVVLPVDKMRAGTSDPEPKKFKTLYLLHGVLGSNMDWISGTSIQRWAENRDLAVVMPSGENSFYFDHTASNTPNENYGTFIGEELPAMMRKTFPLSSKREDTFIGGLSMGGYGALHNGLKYSDTFSRIIALSGAIQMFKDTGGGVFGELNVFGDRKAAAKTDLNPEVALKEAKARGNVPEIFMATGTEDGLYTINEQLKDKLEKEGVSVTWKPGPGQHNWDFWNTKILEALNWLPLPAPVHGISSGHVSRH